VEHALVDMLSADWIDRVEPFDVVLWNPRWMTPASTSYLKEKVWFLEHHLGKIVVPSFASVWHYESKVAQSYLFRALDVPTPHTVATFSAEDAEARLDAETYPLVFKESAGAGSARVTLARDRREAQAKVEVALAQSYWDRFRAGDPSPWARTVSVLGKRWFWAKTRDRLLGRMRTHPAYWQEFIRADGDLRITTMGPRFAQWFFRHNRPDDFRASGAGLVYFDPPPEEVVRYCLELNGRAGIDSAGYDVMFRPDGSFVITEVTYTYPAHYNERAPGHYRLEPDSELRYVEGRRWPQELLAEWAVERAATRTSAGETLGG